MLVIDLAVERHLKPVVAVSGGQSFVEIDRLGCVFPCVGLHLCHITHEVVVAHAVLNAHVPMSSRVDGGVECQASVQIPVAIDILWSRDVSTRRGIVSHEVGYAVPRMPIVGIGHYRALMLGNVGVVIDIERVGELRFQSGISLSDIERVGIVGDIEQRKPTL